MAAVSRNTRLWGRGEPWVSFHSLEERAVEKRHQRIYRHILILTHTRALEQDPGVAEHGSDPRHRRHA